MTRQPRTVPRPELRRARDARALRDRLLAVIRRHPLLTDAALTAVLLAASVPPVSAVAGPDQALSLALIIALVVPLAWRRRAPFGVFVFMIALALVQFFTTKELTDDLALLVAFYTIAAYQPPRRVLLAAAILGAGAVLVASGATHPLPVWAILSGLVAAAAFAAYYARTRRAYLAALVDRAERLERERDQQAQLAAADLAATCATLAEGASPGRFAAAWPSVTNGRALPVLPYAIPACAGCRHDRRPAYAREAPPRRRILRLPPGNHPACTSR
jgi:hypothetical protein